MYKLQEDDELYKKQCRDWDPILQWFNERYGTDVKKTRDIMAPTVSPGTTMAITKHLLSYNEIAMHGNLVI